MSEHIRGRISKITDPNKGGYCALVIDGNFYNSAAKGKPPFAVGDVVEFEYYLKQDKYRTIQGQVTKVAETSAPASSGTSGSKSKDGYWEAKEKYDREVVQPRITFLAAYERALHFTDIVLREKAIPGLEKAKPEARLEIIQNFVQEIAEGIVERSNAKTGPVAINIVTTPAKEEAETEGQWE